MTTTYHTVAITNPEAVTTGYTDDGLGCIASQGDACGEFKVPIAGGGWARLVCEPDGSVRWRNVCFPPEHTEMGIHEGGF